MATITKIPATLSRFTAAPLADTAKRKVAAYARASTDHEEQQSNYEVQVDYYTHYIQSRDDWEFVGVYAEEGITDCNTKNRDGFNRMVEDALVGRIDLIITKSVSRFARNLMDCIGWVEALQNHDPPVRVFFKEEYISTALCLISTPNTGLFL